MPSAKVDTSTRDLYTTVRCVGENSARHQADGAAVVHLAVARHDQPVAEREAGFDHHPVGVRRAEFDGARAGGNRVVLLLGHERRFGKQVGMPAQVSNFRSKVSSASLTVEKSKRRVT